MEFKRLQNDKWECMFPGGKIWFSIERKPVGDNDVYFPRIDWRGPERPQGQICIKMASCNSLEEAKQKCWEKAEGIMAKDFEGTERTGGAQKQAPVPPPGKDKAKRGQIWRHKHTNALCIVDDASKTNVYFRRPAYIDSVWMTMADFLEEYSLLCECQCQRK